MRSLTREAEGGKNLLCAKKVKLGYDELLGTGHFCSL